MATVETLDLRSVRNSETGCLRWMGAHTPKGYGQIVIDGKHRGVHRVAYERAFGPIPDGFEVDHVYAKGCRYRDCIEPSHLEAVTHAENVSRVADKRLECPKGHPYDGANVYMKPDGSRDCRTCKSDRRRAWQSAPGTCANCGAGMRRGSFWEHKKSCERNGDG